MDIFSLLKDDHRKVKKELKELIDQCEDGKLPKSKIEGCIEEIELHTQIEEKHLYPRAEKIKQASNLVSDAYEEHDEVKELISKCEEHLDDPSEVAKYLEMMLVGIEHHVEEEENELFPLMKKELEQSEIDEISEKAASMKERGLSRK